MADVLNVTTPVKAGEDQTRFRSVGVAFPSRPGQNYLFKIRLDANPINGELIVFVPGSADQATRAAPPRLPDMAAAPMRVTTPVTGSDNRTRFRPLGMAFPAAPGKNYIFKAYLDAVPVNGELVLFPAETGDDG
ncbi:hypothetical protein U5903_22200 [Cereibacter johrii]|uniref:hypothetical protein n=1 Tax=Cereibacter johrii TaxID=445629 RepID=UPI002B1F4687|nr:hypothetical protein [Cereibacter johrii]MEA5163493.1 hypothetical protein [Cereibacter johrii]